VAIQLLRSRGLIRRAAVIDLDVHQGDGTAEIFQADDEVFTLSVHCRSNFPFRKQKSKLDVDLPDKVEDDEYLERLDQVLPEVFASRPDIIFYQSGVDALYSDALGHLSLTHAGMEERDRRVMRAAREKNIPFVLTMGGGYSKPIELSVQAHANTYTTVCALWPE
jgi:acetoin utilization deacetylase AcuC-like enzyme